MKKNTFKYHHIYLVMLILQLAAANLFSADGGREILPKGIAIVLEEVLKIWGRGEFIRVEEILSGIDGDIYVTDAYQYSVRRYSPAGVLKREFGVRGKGDDAFEGVPYKIFRLGRWMAIAEKGIGRIRWYRPGFAYAETVTLPGVVVDAIADGGGKVYVNLIPFSKKVEDLLVVVDTMGSIMSRIPLVKVAETPVMNMVHLNIDSRNDLVVAYRFMNIVSVYNSGGNLLKSFGIGGLPTEAVMESTSVNENGPMPAGDLIADLGVDRRTDYIFILSGAYSEHPYRDVVVVGTDGAQVAEFQLPAKSGILYIDDAGFLFTRESERTIIKKYRIVYKMTGHK